MDNKSNRQSFIDEEQDALYRMNSAIQKIEEGNMESICDIKHAIGCVVRMMHLYNLKEKNDES